MRSVHDMPRARKHLVCVAETPYYHITSRCVRRAYLCGVDRYSGRSYEHRRAWVEDQIRVLSSIFSVSICAYAVMSNHYHLVVRLNPEEANAWSDQDVLDRWTSLFRGPLLVQRQLAGEVLSEAEADTLRSIVSVYRQRLGDLSWFMKCLNEPIARKANAEDRCTGHFWEARFHSQALLSDDALIAAMAYVDLNPVRAGTARTPEASRYTSMRARTQEKCVSAELRASIEKLLQTDEIRHFNLPVRPLMPFAAKANEPASPDTSDSALPVRENDYLELVDLTGRIQAHGKCGQVDQQLAPILERIGLSSEAWPIPGGGLKAHLQKQGGGRKKLA